MAVLSWVDIASTRIDAGSVINEDLVDDIHNNQEALVTQQCDCRWGTLSTTAASELFSTEVFIPESAGTTNGDTVLIVRLRKQVTSGVTGRVDLKLGLGSTVSSSTFTNLTWDTIEITIPVASVRAAAGTVSTLYITLVRTAGTGTVYAENIRGSSRLER